MEFALEPLQEKITHIHPNKFIRVATPLYKRRGKLTATVRSDWVERLFVLTDTALYWYRLSEDLGGGLLKIGPQALGSEQLGTQQGRVDVRHVVSIKQVELHGDPPPPRDVCMSGLSRRATTPRINRVSPACRSIEC